MMSELIDVLRPILADSYQIERQVGSGGMAIVYLARDQKHRRPVALKVLRPELALTLAADRFLREIEIAASLQHPNILPLYDSAQADGYLYYVMPYVRGETLRALLLRKGQLPLEEALRIAHEVGDALGHAHSQGVVHRDVKPENILFYGGHAVVSDFGIARAVTEAAGDRITNVGHAIGTAPYMSPEQADNVVDARSDIYSLACVFYEMLMGEPPFSGPSPLAIMVRHATAPLPPLRLKDVSVSERLEEAVHKALAKKPPERFASAPEFVAALEFAARERPSAREGPALHVGAVEETHCAIAVLPLANLSPVTGQEYLADGLTEEIISGLSKVPGLRVASRTSAFACKGTKMDLQTIGQRLNVDTVLNGSVRREGDRVRITAELTSVHDGYVTWSRNFERTIEDLFDLQDEISRAIVDEIQPTLARPFFPLRPPAASVSAYQLYLRGRYFWNQRTREGHQQALQCYQAALAEDPDYALAYSGLADVYISLSQFQYAPPRSILPKAERAARKALELDSTLAQAHNSLAHVLDVYHWDWPAAEHEYLRALELDPSYAMAHSLYSDFLMVLGRHSEAVVEMERALELEPFAIPIEFQAATLTYRSRRFDDAVRRYRELVELDPQFYPAHVLLSIAMLRSGRGDEAEQMLMRISDRVGAWPAFQMALGYTYALTGKRAKAVSVVNDLCKRAAKTYVPTGTIAVVYAGLELRDEAFVWLEKAFEERSLAMTLLPVDPMLDSLRGDRRFDDLLRRVFGSTLSFPNSS